MSNSIWGYTSFIWRPWTTSLSADHLCNGLGIVLCWALCRRCRTLQVTSLMQIVLGNHHCWEYQYWQLQSVIHIRSKRCSFLSWPQVLTFFILVSHMEPHCVPQRACIVSKKHVYNVRMLLTCYEIWGLYVPKYLLLKFWNQTCLCRFIVWPMETVWVWYSFLMI